MQNKLLNGLILLFIRAGQKTPSHQIGSSNAMKVYQCSLEICSRIMVNAEMVRKIRLSVGVVENWATLSVTAVSGYQISNRPILSTCTTHLLLLTLLSKTQDLSQKTEIGALVCVA